MASVELRDQAGQAVGTVELPDEVYGIEPNIAVVHSVITNYLSSLRQGSHATKGRSQVSGGGRKPWRQKGTGRARQGSIRAAQWRGGGVAFGPTPHLHIKRSNKKEIKLAMRSVLSGKLADGELVVVDALSFDKPKTKEAAKVLEALGAAGKRATVVVPRDSRTVELSFRNIPGVRVVEAGHANAHSLVDNACLIMTADVATHFGEVLR